jgi:hypothetical protein
MSTRLTALGSHEACEPQISNKCIVTLAAQVIFFRMKHLISAEFLRRRWRAASAYDTDQSPRRAGALTAWLAEVEDDLSDARPLMQIKVGCADTPPF